MPVSGEERPAGVRAAGSASAGAATRAESAGSCVPGGQPMMDPQWRAEVLLRLSKAAGQVRGVARMVNDDRYCVDVLTQIRAAQKALDAAAKIITRNYLERCVTDAINGGDPLIYDELMRVIYHSR
jgi:DNA-binding FrmR family transcriptional regulator